MKKSKVKDTLDVAIAKVIKEYIDIPFIDCKEDLEKDFKKTFKKYPEWEYKGYYTQLGSLFDLKLYYNLKETK